MKIPKQTYTAEFKELAVTRVKGCRVPASVVRLAAWKRETHAHDKLFTYAFMGLNHHK